MRSKHPHLTKRQRIRKFLHQSFKKCSVKVCPNLLKLDEKDIKRWLRVAAEDCAYFLKRGPLQGHTDGFALGDDVEGVLFIQIFYLDRRFRNPSRNPTDPKVTRRRIELLFSPPRLS